MWIAFAGHWLIPCKIDPLPWALIWWLLARWVRMHSDTLLIWLDAVFAFATDRRLSGADYARTWLRAGREQPWSVIWPRLRNLTVS